MNYYIKICLRILIIIFLAIIYFNYRNNQCILKQNCSPIFLSNLFSVTKKFENYAVIFFKFNLNVGNVEFIADKNFNLNNSNFNSVDKMNKSNIDYFSTLENFKGYNNFIMKNDSSLTVAKFSITNKSPKQLKISLKVNDKTSTLNLDPQFSKDSIKIFNCFCNQDIILNEFETKDLFIYFKFNKPVFNLIDIDISQKKLIK